MWTKTCALIAVAAVTAFEAHGQEMDLELAALIVKTRQGCVATPTEPLWAPTWKEKTRYCDCYVLEFAKTATKSDFTAVKLTPDLQ